MSAPGAIAIQEDGGLLKIQVRGVSILTKLDIKDPVKNINRIFASFKKSGLELTNIEKQKILEHVNAFLEGKLKEKQTHNLSGKEGYFDDQGKFVPKLLAEELMNEYSFATMRDNEQIYVWQDGYYRPYAETLIKEECKKRLGEEYRITRVNEVIDYIKASTFTERREEPPFLIPLKNGILNLQTMQLMPHSPEYMFFNLLPVEYRPGAKCPTIEKFLNEITGSKEDVQLLLEVIGFCLYRDYFIAKALMLVGEGSNGKSTFLNLVKAFLGRENVSSRSLQDLEENRFAKADLHHKLANIYADLPDKALWRTGTFKMLTGRDYIAAEYKFQQPFHFVNYAKLLFSANKVPEAYDDTDAFFRRWIIVVFPNQFVNDKADPNILEKLTAPEELSGLLNLVLPALRRLLQTGTFSYTKTTEEIREDYIRKSSPIGAFVMDCLAVDSDAFIPKQELFNVFAEYCRTRKIPCVTKDTFFKNLPQHLPVIDYRPKIGKDRPVTFKGIRYGEGVAKLSNVSRVFYSLSPRRQDYENSIWSVREVNEEFIEVRLKEGRTLDTSDTFDTMKNELAPEKKENGTLDTLDRTDTIKIKEVVRLALEDSFPGECAICHSATVIEGYIEGEPACGMCIKKEEGRARALEGEGVRPVNPVNPSPYPNARAEQKTRTCQECKWWSNFKCSKRPELVCVLPSHLVCELFEPKEAFS